jgi:hypothetical protein
VISMATAPTFSDRPTIPHSAGVRTNPSVTQRAEKP